MEISRYGKFSFTIDPKELSKGLRPSKRVPRNSNYLIECDGAVGRDGVLQVLDELTRIDTTELGAINFPYPQLFVFTNIILVCTNTKIYEYETGSLSLKLNVQAGNTWTAVDFFDYIYMSNGTVAVMRNPDTRIFTVTSDLPRALAICNFNGQVLIGTSEE
jgi:hypothetical protein